MAQVIRPYQIEITAADLPIALQHGALQNFAGKPIAEKGGLTVVLTDRQLQILCEGGSVVLTDRQLQILCEGGSVELDWNPSTDIYCR